METSERKDLVSNFLNQESPSPCVDQTDPHLKRRESAKNKSLNKVHTISYPSSALKQAQKE